MRTLFLSKEGPSSGFQKAHKKSGGNGGPTTGYSALGIERAADGFITSPRLPSKGYFLFHQRAAAYRRGTRGKPVFPGRVVGPVVEQDLEIATGALPTALVVQETHYDPWGLELAGIGRETFSILRTRR